jgi:hypothetical protein
MRTSRGQPRDALASHRDPLVPQETAWPSALRRALGQPSANSKWPVDRAGNCTAHAIVADPDAMKVASPNRGQPRFGTDSGTRMQVRLRSGPHARKSRNASSELRRFGEPNAEADRRGNCAVRRWTRTDSAFGRPSAGGVHTTNSSPAASGRRDGEHGTLFDRANGRRERGAQTRGAGNRVAGAWTRRNDLAGHRGLGSSRRQTHRVGNHAVRACDTN